MASADISQPKSHFMNHTHSLFPAPLNPVKSRIRTEQVEFGGVWKPWGSLFTRKWGSAPSRRTRREGQSAEEETYSSAPRGEAPLTMERVPAPAAGLGEAVGNHPLAVALGQERRDGGARGPGNPFPDGCREGRGSSWLRHVPSRLPERDPRCLRPLGQRQMKEPRAVCARGGRRGAGSRCRPELSPRARPGPPPNLPAPHGLSRGPDQAAADAQQEGEGGSWTLSGPGRWGHGQQGWAPARPGSAPLGDSGCRGHRGVWPPRTAPPLLASPPGAADPGSAGGPGRPCPVLPAPGSQLSSAWHEMCRGAAEPLWRLDPLRELNRIAKPIERLFPVSRA